MPERYRPKVGAEADQQRFDGETARQILARAANEQSRLNSALADSYTLADLEEMAAEAGISREALDTAIEARRAEGMAARRGEAIDARCPEVIEPRRLGAREARLLRLIPGRSHAVKRAVLIGAGVLVLGAVLLAFPAVGEALYWGTLLSLILLSVLILLGIVPF